MPVSLYVSTVLIVVGLLCAAGAVVVTAQDQQPPSCQEQLMAAKAMAGNFQNDYLRKQNELVNAQVQASKALQKVQLLEKELAALRTPEAPK